MRGQAVVKVAGKSLEGLAAISLLTMVVVTTIDVFGRYLFNTPLSGSIEIVRITLAAVVFSAFPLVTWREDHICVDLLDDYVPTGWVRWRQAAINLASAFALGLVANKVWQLAERSLSYGDETDVLGFPIGFLVYFISLMSALSMLAALILAAAYIFHVPVNTQASTEEISK